MRIGEILIGAQLISAKELEQALDYAAQKGVPVGRALRALRFLTEPDLTRGLDAQIAIRKGLNPTMGMSALRYSYQTNRSYLEALKAWPGTIGKEQIPQAIIDALSEKSLEQTAVRQKPDIKQASDIAQAQQEISSRIAQRAANLEQLSAHISSSNSIPVVQKTPADKPGSSSPPESGIPRKGPEPRQEEQNAESLILEGDRLFAANKCIPAEKSYELALRQLEETYGTPPSKIASALTKLANLYIVTERYDYAEPLYKRIIQVQTKIFGDKSPEVGKAIEDLADLKTAQNKLPEAQELLAQAVAIAEHQKILDVHLAGRLLKKMALVHRFDNPSQRTRIGELAQDAQLVPADKLNDALQKSREGGVLLGMVLRTENILDAQQVESLMLAQLLIKQGTITVPVAISSLKLAAKHSIPLRQLCDAGRWITEAEGDERYQSLVVEQERLLAAETALGPDHPEVLILLQKIADLHLSRKDRLSAEMFYKRAMTSLQKAKDVDKIGLARVTEKLAQTYCQQGKYFEAQPLLLKSLEYRQASGAGETAEAAKCLWLIAKVELAQFNYATALSFLRSARTMLNKLVPGKCPRQLLEEMHTCSLETGSSSDLESVLQQLIEHSEPASEESKTAALMEQLGDLYVSSDRRDEARKLYASSLEIYVRASSAQEKTQAISKKLAQVT